MVVYRIFCKENGKSYVGQTIRKFIYRKSYHIWKLGNDIHRNSYLQNAWNKYGEESFEFEILEECDSINELNEREVYWIKKLKTLNRDTGYNLRTGGLNDSLSKETKEKLKEINTKRKGVEVHQYDLDGNYINSYLSLIEAYRQTNADRKAIKMCAEGEFDTAGGFQWSYEKKDEIKKVSKHRIGKKKKVNQYDLNGNFIKTYNSMKEAENETGTYVANISACCRKKVKTANNFIWRYHASLER